jgi:hypothetical protein
MSYTPKFCPTNPDVRALAQYLSDELQALSIAQSEAVDFVELTALKRAPSRLVDGMVVCANGVDWQPLSAGGGYFGYFGGACVKLG